MTSISTHCIRKCAEKKDVQQDDDDDGDYDDKEEKKIHHMCIPNQFHIVFMSNEI